MPPLTPPDTILTPEQRDMVDSFLSVPMKFPSELKAWLPDYLSLNVPYIPVSQLLGYKGTLAHNEIVNDAIAVTSPERTWSDQGGPYVTGLADGVYFCAWGCKTGRGATGGATTRMGVSVNGADPTAYATFQTTDPDAPVWRGQEVEARGGQDNNSIDASYWFDLGGGASAQFEQRWLTVLRVT